MRIKSIATFGCILAMAAASIQALGQGPQDGPRQRQEHQLIIQGESALPRVGPPMAIMQGAEFGGDKFVFVSSEMSFDGRVVKGAPYSAVAVNESIQTLADGNRIVRKTTASVYRDSEGRTRRDQTLGKIGPYASAGDPPQTIFINDPVAGVNYVLEPNSRTARKMSMPRWSELKGDPDKARIVKAAEAKASAEAAAQSSESVKAELKKRVAVGAEAGFVVTVNDGVEMKAKIKPNKESLGKQMIEGVEAEGTRITFTIAAGDIGNEMPITIVSEQYYSPELQTVVMSRHSDPRSGETIYRLTNINRSEPPHSVFEVPADYTIKEAVTSDMKFRIEKEIQRTKKDDQQ